MPAQRPSDPATAAQARGRFFDPGNGFNVQLAPVPDHLFTAEPAAALNPDAPTGLIACDISQQLTCPFPATTPLVLARYARIRAGETLTTEFAASGIVCYVIQGAGNTEGGSGRIDWHAGDVFILPGGPAYSHSADTDAVLWIVTNEPQLAFERLRPPADGDAPTAIVHFAAGEIARQIDFISEIGRTAEIPGSALVFSSAEQEAGATSADADSCDELPAGGPVAAAAYPQLRRRQPDYQGRAVLFGDGWPPQGLGPGPPASPRRSPCIRTIMVATSKPCS